MGLLHPRKERWQGGVLAAVIFIVLSDAGVSCCSRGAGERGVSVGTVQQKTHTTHIGSFKFSSSHITKVKKRKQQRT